MTDNGMVKATTDYVRGVFITRSGLELKLQRVSPLIMERIHSDQAGKPEIPKVQVTVAGEHVRNEANPLDPDYLEALEDWRKDHGVKVMKYAFTHGIVNDPPKEFLEEHKEFFPEATFRDLKYLWIVSLVDGSEDDLTLLMESVLGIGSVTEKGVEKAMDSFQGDSGRDGHSAVPTPTAPSPDIL